MVEHFPDFATTDCGINKIKFKDFLKILIRFIFRFDETAQNCVEPDSSDCTPVTIPTAPTVDPENICRGVPDNTYVGSHT